MVCADVSSLVGGWEGMNSLTGRDDWMKDRGWKRMGMMDEHMGWLDD